MSDTFPERMPFQRHLVPAEELVDYTSEERRQYQRAREYCGFSLDQLINSRAAQQYLREIWLVGCMVRKPQKASRLPPGNPFRSASG